MRILGIETSCDETAASIVENGVHVYSSVIATSKQAFEKLAGVIPEEAARMQVECIIPVVDQALTEAQMKSGDIDAIAVTKGPGLLGSLLAGTVSARVLAHTWKKPLIGVHHTFGHLSSSWLATNANNPPLFPILTLSVSGGHTDLWLRTSHTRGTILGSTRDDAAGEAFDKGAHVLGLPYPGGPHLAKRAEAGDAATFRFPLPLRDDPSLDFSFSGLKTALKYLLRDEHIPLDSADVAASFEHAICLHLMDKLSKAVALHSEVREIHVVGGVSANQHLRMLLQALCDAEKLVLRWPNTLGYCTDNAAMIAAAGFFLLQEGHTPEAFETMASLPIASALS